jgi:hypothetical protein
VYFYRLHAGKMSCSQDDSHQVSDVVLRNGADNGPRLRMAPKMYYIPTDRLFPLAKHSKKLEGEGVTHGHSSSWDVNLISHPHDIFLPVGGRKSSLQEILSKYDPDNMSQEDRNRLKAELEEEGLGVTEYLSALDDADSLRHRRHRAACPHER